MAYTSVIPVRRLDRAVKYVMNKAKDARRYPCRTPSTMPPTATKQSNPVFGSSYACTLDNHRAFRICARQKNTGTSRVVCRDTTLYRVLLQMRSRPNLRTGSVQKNLQTAVLGGRYDHMSSAHTLNTGHIHFAYCLELGQLCGWQRSIAATSKSYCDGNPRSVR